MTKEVLISIRGLQMEEESEEESGPIEVIVPGQYYYKNNRHYLFFEEILEGTKSVTKSVIKLSGDCVEVNRKGALNVNMEFRKNKATSTCYYTPYGSFQVGIETGKVQILESGDRIEATVEYALDFNYEKAADSRIHILVRPKGAEIFAESPGEKKEENGEK